MRIPRSFALSLAGLIVATACGGGTTGGGSAAPVAVKLTDGKVVIGVINDQSGVYADLSGKNGVEAVNMAIADFKAKYGDNALGGPIEVISADHKNDPALASSKATEFYERSNADIILDVPTSSGALAIAKVAGDEKKLYINITAATTDLTGPACNKYTFHYAYDTYMLAQGTGTAVVAAGGKQWYIIYPNYAFGQDMTKSFSAAVTASGGTVIGSDGSPFPNQTGDFSSLLLKAGQLKPQILGVMQAGGDLVNVVKQYNEFKLKDQGVKLAVGLMFDTDITALGLDALAGVQYTTPWIWNEDAASIAFADKFLAKTKIRPTFAHAGDYSATMQYLEAIRRAGSDDADAVVKALEGYKFNDFFIHNGQIRAEDHWVMHDAFLAQVKSKAESKETFDYAKILTTLPADKASRPLAETGCKMPK
ncbi:MAG: ABC transporter substrate-binding protein [Chloroflexota bacterium]|nr:ABC transporter substrate-binding protein [Chloroflexota bacterium]